jgi:hypothetical protein
VWSDGGDRAAVDDVLGGGRDAVVADELDRVTIVDPHVIATRGSDRHPVSVEADDCTRALVPPHLGVVVTASVAARCGGRRVATPAGGGPSVTSAGQADPTYSTFSTV